MHVAEAEFAVSLVLLFALSLLAVYVGVAAIVGAFLAGMALAEHVEPRVHDLAHGVTELLVPFFLVGIGLHVDLRVFASPAILLLALVILLAAVALEIRRLRSGRLETRPSRRAADRRGHGAARRGRHGGGANRPRHGRHSAEHLRGGGVHGGRYDLVAPPLLNVAYRKVPGGYIGPGDGMRGLQTAGRGQPGARNPDSGLAFHPEVLGSPVPKFTSKITPVEQPRVS